MALLVLFLSFAIFAGGVMILSLRNGLNSYRARMGADIVVVPASASSHGTVDDIFLQGITGNYYMSGKEVEKVLACEGIARVSPQFFLTSAKASCCSTRVQIIGFDPETDFSIQPWVGESYSGSISDGEVIVGAKINVPENRKITFYGTEYLVAAQLAETGTGLDSAVYTNMPTIQEMAKNAARLLETSPFQGVELSTAASAMLIQVADGYEISDVADDINIHITKVQATPARNMISDISRGLGNVAMVIGGMVLAVWILSAVILLAMFLMMANERKREFAVLRVLGASRKLLFGVISWEAVMVSLAGGAGGLLLGLLVILSLSGTLQAALNLPMVLPGAGALVLLGLGALAAAALVGLLTATFSAKKIAGSEAGLLLREDR